MKTYLELLKYTVSLQNEIELEIGLLKSDNFIILSHKEKGIMSKFHGEDIEKVAALCLIDLAKFSLFLLPRKDEFNYEPKFIVHIF